MLYLNTRTCKLKFLVVIRGGKNLDSSLDSERWEISNGPLNRTGKPKIAPRPRANYAVSPLVLPTMDPPNKLSDVPIHPASLQMALMSYPPSIARSPTLPSLIQSFYDTYLWLSAICRILIGSFVKQGRR